MRIYSIKSPLIKKNRKKSFSTIFILILLLGGSPRAVVADTYDNRINNLKQLNVQSQDAQANLQIQADSISATISDLQSKIATLQTQITENNTKAEAIRAQIAQSEAQIAEQRRVLGTSVRQMYFDGQITTLEKLASSKDFSAYVDRETYSQTVSSKIKESVDTIKALKSKQEQDKAAVEALIRDESAMQSQIAEQQNESKRLLSLNLQQQASFAASVTANNAKIESLRKQQAAENLKTFSQPISRKVSSVGSTSTVRGVSGDAYPYKNAPWPNAIADPWGMYMRQCVSYTAWKVAASGRHMPFWGGVGNARNWPTNAMQAGIAVDSNPRIGDVAISLAGTYGHAMYVEAVNGDGTVTISQYNAGWDGVYSEGRRSAAGLYFIHF